jgi:hypothetical protein
MASIEVMKASRGLPQPLGELRYTAAPGQEAQPRDHEHAEMRNSWRIAAPGHWSGPDVTESAS